MNVLSTVCKESNDELIECVLEDSPDCGHCLAKEKSDAFPSVDVQLSTEDAIEALCTELLASPFVSCDCLDCKEEIDAYYECRLEEALGLEGDSDPDVDPYHRKIYKKSGKSSDSRDSKKDDKKDDKEAEDLFVCVSNLTEAPTLAPTPAPTMTLAPTLPESEGGSICFSGRNTVTLQDGTVKKMQDVQVGDYVFDGTAFTRVYAHAHANQKLDTAWEEYLTIHAAGLDRPLEISSQHMLSVQNAKTVLASHLIVGDVLLGDHKVTKIQTVQRRGKYAPLTESGWIQVSGVTASSYASVFDVVPPHLHHPLAHAFLTPARWMCAMDFSICESTRYIEDDSAWLYPALQLAGFLKPYSNTMQLVGLAVGGPLVVCLTYPGMVAALVGLAWFVFTKCGATTKSKKVVVCN